MGNLRLSITMSLDGYVAGPAQSVENPLGVGGIAPVILGDGARLFDGLEGSAVKLEQIRAVDAPGVTHIKYRVV